MNKECFLTGGFYWVDFTYTFQGVSFYEPSLKPSFSEHRTSSKGTLNPPRKELLGGAPRPCFLDFLWLEVKTETCSASDLSLGLSPPGS